MARNRSRAYYRDVRERKIAHKKHICQKYYGQDWYSVDGKYSKGKIHCSCPLCSCKSKNRKSPFEPKINWKHSDRQKIESAESQLYDYFEQEPLQLEAETADIDVNVVVDDVLLDGVPLDGHYFEHLIDTIDF